MSDLTNLTYEECEFLFDVLKREENRWRLPVSDATGGNASADKNQQQKMLKDLIWRLQVICSSTSEFDRALNRELITERLAGYC